MGWVFTFTDQSHQSRVKVLRFHRGEGWAGPWAVLAILFQPETKLRFLRCPNHSLVPILTAISRRFHTEDQFYVPSDLHAALPKAITKLLHVGGSPVGTLHCRADVFETGARLRFLNNPSLHAPGPYLSQGTSNSIPQAGTEGASVQREGQESHLFSPSLEWTPLYFYTPHSIVIPVSAGMLNRDQ